MASCRSKLSICVTILALIVLQPLPSHSIDPSPLQDFCIADLKSTTHLNGFPCINPADVTSTDFFYQGLQKPGQIFNKYNINITKVDVKAFPALNTMGMSMTRLQLLPGGINPPHVHPRAAELGLVAKGTLFVGIVSTENVLYGKTITAGELFVIPQGLLHFALNVGEEDGLVFSTFSSQSPGTLFIAQVLFESTPLIADEVLSKTFKVNDTIIELIRAGLAGVPPYASYENKMMKTNKIKYLNPII